jgi:NTP pyrophosphatase (non-canonical NTP hydrolase)
MTQMTITHEFLRQFRQANLKRNSQYFSRLGDWQLDEWVACLLGEIGEGVDAVKKLKRASSGQPGITPADILELNKEVSHEMADVFTYLDIIASKMLIYPEEMYPLEPDIAHWEKAFRDVGESSLSIWLHASYSCYKLSSFYGSDAQNRQCIRDIICILLLLANRRNFNLQEAVREKFNIVSDRVGSTIKL